MSIRNQRRIETQRQIDALRKELRDWTANAKTLDARRQYETQLESLTQSLERALEQIRHRAEAVPDTAAEAFRLGRIEERYLLWVRSLWEPFRDAFAQREASDPRHKTLKIADEVVWSCFEPFAEDENGARRAAPLAVIANVSAQVRSRESTYDFLPSILDVPAPLLQRAKQVLNQLPMPLVYVPASAVTSPWQLSVLAHEVGHVVQSDHRPDTAYLQEFAGQLRDWAGAVQPGARSRWRGWGNEVFADGFAAHALGPGAASTLFDVVYDVPESMAVGNNKYPPALVRLRLTALICKAIHGSAEPYYVGQALIDGQSGLPAQTEEDLKIAEKVAAELAALPGPLARLRTEASELVKGSQEGEAALWAGEAILPKSALSVRKLMAAATVVASEAKEEDWDRIRGNLYEVVLASGPEGVRAGGSSEPVSAVEDAFNEIPMEVWEA